jgi:hypothetical protein
VRDRSIWFGLSAVARCRTYLGLPGGFHGWPVVIGSGAGGGTLFHALAPTGKRILLLERGGYVPREKANWSTRAVNLEGRYNTTEVWRDQDGGELHPHTNYYVGRNTKFYGAALFRLRREDFGEIKHHALHAAHQYRQDRAPRQKAEMEAILHGHERFEAELPAASKMVHTERLRSDEEASRIRLKAGPRQVTDGPFTETKEILGVFYLIECDTKNEAIEWAKKIPLREDRTVEVRPIWPR